MNPVSLPCSFMFADQSWKLLSLLYNSIKTSLFYNNLFQKFKILLKSSCFCKCIYMIKLVFFYKLLICSNLILNMPTFVGWKERQYGVLFFNSYLYLICYCFSKNLTSLYMAKSLYFLMFCKSLIMFFGCLKK